MAIWPVCREPLYHNYRIIHGPHASTCSTTCTLYNKHPVSRGPVCCRWDSSCYSGGGSQCTTCRLTGGIKQWLQLPLWCSVPGQSTKFQGINVAASFHTNVCKLLHPPKIKSRVTHVRLCAHGHLPGILQYYEDCSWLITCTKGSFHMPGYATFLSRKVGSPEILLTLHLFPTPLPPTNTTWWRGRGGGGSQLLQNYHCILKNTVLESCSCIMESNHFRWSPCLLTVCLCTVKFLC